MMISLRSKVTHQALAEMFLRPERAFYVNELARRLGLDSGNLTRKLHELEDTGLLKSDTRGRERYYSLNKAYPFLAEYRKIILKTFGAEEALKRLLSEVPGIQKAFIYGSYAKDKMTDVSDIDVCVVGEHRALDLQRRVSVLQKKVSRDINITSLSAKEYESKRLSDSFFKNIDAGPKVILI